MRIWRGGAKGGVTCLVLTWMISQKWLISPTGAVAIEQPQPNRNILLGGWVVMSVKKVSKLIVLSHYREKRKKNSVNTIINTKDYISKQVVPSNESHPQKIQYQYSLTTFIFCLFPRPFSSLGVRQGLAFNTNKMHTQHRLWAYQLAPAS